VYSVYYYNMDTLVQTLGSYTHKNVHVPRVCGGFLVCISLHGKRYICMIVEQARSFCQLLRKGKSFIP